MSVSVDTRPPSGLDDFINIIKDPVVFARRIEELKAQERVLDQKIALAGDASEIVRLKREAATERETAAAIVKGAQEARDETSAHVTAAREAARDHLNRTVAQAGEDAAKIVAEAQRRADEIVSAASAHAAELKADYERRVEALRKITS